MGGSFFIIVFASTLPKALIGESALINYSPQKETIMKINTILAIGTLLYPQIAKADLYKCELCPAGTYSDGKSLECSKCPVGTYSNKSGVSSCTPCTNFRPSFSHYTTSGGTKNECAWSCDAGLIYTSSNAGGCCHEPAPATSSKPSSSSSSNAGKTKCTCENRSGTYVLRCNGKTVDACKTPGQVIYR